MEETEGAGANLQEKTEGYALNKDLVQTGGGGGVSNRALGGGKKMGQVGYRGGKRRKGGGVRWVKYHGKPPFFKRGARGAHIVKTYKQAIYDIGSVRGCDRETGVSRDL